MMKQFVYNKEEKEPIEAIGSIGDEEKTNVFYNLTFDKTGDFEKI